MAGVARPSCWCTQNELFRSYADFGSHPDADFTDMAYAVSEDPSMLRYLNGESNVRGGPNENYARELMELFALGVRRRRRASPNYTEDDVKQLAKALSGWPINDTDPNNATASLRLVAAGTRAQDRSSGKSRQQQGTADAVDTVLAPPGARALHRQPSSGTSSSSAPPDAATLADLTTTLHERRLEAQAGARARSSRTRSSSRRSTSRT